MVRGYCSFPVKAGKRTLNRDFTRIGDAERDRTGKIGIKRGGENEGFFAQVQRGGGGGPAGPVAVGGIPPIQSLPKPRDKIALRGREAGRCYYRDSLTTKSETDSVAEIYS